MNDSKVASTVTNPSVNEDQLKRGPGRPAKVNSVPNVYAFLDKEVIDTMNDFYSFRDYQKRFKIGTRQICYVSEDVYDIVTEGDKKSPLFWSQDVPVVDSTRKEEAIKLMNGGPKIPEVIISGTAPQR